MTHTAPTPGTPCWIDLGSSDRDTSITFYTRLFGWDITTPNEAFGGYANFLLDGRPVAGLMTRQPEQTGDDAWSTYFASDDAEATLASASAAGGQVALPVHPVGDLGAMAFLVDPCGAMVGVWQPGTHVGFDQERPVNGPLWFELEAPDHEAAVAFHAAVFELRTERVPGDRAYTALAPRASDVTRAAVMTLPDSARVGWVPYFRVDDVDDACERAVALGGQRVAGPVDTPYGRMASLVDATGARFKVMDPTTRCSGS
ncbi:MAG: VOC family protein [Alphaproteobacteria bacterium]|nr:VOC family protein [Alphaproteobacteria bacterium]MCB9699807.1 VOC family protein [Alphaproteobacteria bacterium]